LVEESKIETSLKTKIELLEQLVGLKLLDNKAKNQLSAELVILKGRGN
jgi:hypothetical protein